VKSFSYLEWVGSLNLLQALNTKRHPTDQKTKQERLESLRQSEVPFHRYPEKEYQEAVEDTKHKELHLKFII